MAAIVVLLLCLCVGLAAGTLLWPDECAVREWLPALLQQRLGIGLDTACAAIAAAGFALDSLTVRLRRWRERKLEKLPSFRRRLAEELINAMSCDDDDEEFDHDILMSKLEQLIDTQLDAEASSEPPLKKGKPEPSKPDPQPLPPPVKLEQATAMRVP